MWNLLYQSVGIFLFILTYSYLETRKRVKGKQCSPRTDAISDASDQGLRCFHKKRIKVTK